MNKQCSKEGCLKTFPDTREGHSKAWRDGWFIGKWNGPAWCPEDLPEWLSSSIRETLGGVKNGDQEAEARSGHEEAGGVSC